MNTSMEKYTNEKYDRQVEAYEARYGKRFEALAKSNSFKGRLSKNDIYNLGAQFDTFKRYENYVAENGGSASALGALPRVALDVISASYALSIAPQLASIQTLNDAQGIIYFKKVFTHGYPLTAVDGLPALPEERWMDANGNVAGQQTFNGAWKKWLDAQARPSSGPTSSGEPDTLNPTSINAKNFDAITMNAFKGWQSSPTAYISERQFAALTTQETYIANAIGALRWNVPMNVRLVKTDTGAVTDVVGVCAGPGTVPTFYGNVTVYAAQGTGTHSGDLKITIPAGYTGIISYDVDFEKAPDVPAVEFGLDSKIVSAEIIGVKELLGTFKSFQFNKRFGKAASDEVLADLSGHMAMAESEKVLAALSSSASKWKPVTWDMNKSGAISEFEHRQSLLYAIQEASAAIAARAGKGYANKLVCGYVSAQYVASLPSFRPAPKTNLVGPHVFGTLENEGITVIRSNTIVAPNEIICAYSADNSPFEAPVVCATYMPVFVTNTMPVAENPFQSQQAIASWKAITPIVDEFVQRIVLVKNVTEADVNVFLTGTPNSGSGSKA